MSDLQSLWDFDDPSASEARFRERAESLVAGTPERLEAETQCARAIGLQRRFNEAHALLDSVERALAGRDEDEAGVTPASVRYLIERGRVLNSSGRRDDARPRFVEAFDRALLAGLDALAIDAAHMVAIAEAPERQMAWNERALVLSQTSTDPTARRWRASLLNNMGWTRHGEGAYGIALELFEQALDARREQGDEGTIRIARWCVARCLRSLNRLEAALAEQERLAAELASAEQSDGFVEEERAECLLALGRAAEAKPHFARALELLGADTWFVANEPERLARLRSLAL